METLSLLLIALSCVSLLCCAGRGVNNNKNMQSKTKSAIVYDTLAAEACSYDYKNNAILFRLIVPNDPLFDYCVPDYDGGFYLFVQTVAATSREMKKQVPFDALKDKPVNYVLHYIGEGGSKIGGGDDNPNVVSFTISNYYVESIVLPEGSWFDSFDPVNKDNRWERYEGIFGNSSLPSPDLVRVRVNVYTSSKNSMRVRS